MCESDSKLEEISAIGNGSTFTSMAFQGRAQEMGVLNRYSRFLSEPAYLEPLRRFPELADVSRELFDMEPPKGIHI